VGVVVRAAEVRVSGSQERRRQTGGRTCV